MIQIKFFYHSMSDLDESLIPYFVDLVDYEKISNLKLKDQIDKYGEIFYSRKKPD